MKETTSKTMDGISDLVVFAPIREGFIKAFETITYASRLELVANALNRLRIAAREYERVTPYSDVAERILSLLDFRVGVIDENLFGLARLGGGGHTLKAKRYLYLTATFDGGFEPYMRQIWRPLGPFLDLLFCNCEGYITATDHSFDEYIQWVRDNQMDSAIFYNTTGLTVRDQKYLASFEKAQRAGRSEPDDPAENILAKHVMAFPDDDAKRVREGTSTFIKSVELGFEALNVLYKLTDYYPPEWLTGVHEEPEGHRLVRATRDLLLGWDGLLKKVRLLANGPVGARLKQALETYEEPINWYETGLEHIEKLDEAAKARESADPDFQYSEVQSGILKAHGSRAKPVTHGAMLFFTIRNAKTMREVLARWLADGAFGFGDAAVPDDVPAVFANIALTSQGLLELGMPYEDHDCLPKEFREGLAQRSSQVGDMRENHPRNWILPLRNGPEFLGAAEDKTLPPVALEEVDFVIQLRGFDQGAVEDMARRRASEAGAGATPGARGATLEAIEWLHVQADGGRFIDHFGFVDGISQPRPIVPGEPPGGLDRDRVALGEVILGYANDRGDGPAKVFADLDARKSGETNTAWRTDPRDRALKLLENGSFAVVRKIGEDVGALETWLSQHQDAVARQLDCTPNDAKARLKAAILGREANGAPLTVHPPASDNDFDYRDDPGGVACPHAAHIRRANPRRWDKDESTSARREFDRPTPRLLRRGMLFGSAAGESRGLMFVAYASSIAEQYEVIQRWLNGGNPTDVASANNDPLTGVRPKDGSGTFRFISERKDGAKVVVRVDLPKVFQPSGDDTQPGRHPFTPLYWGLYLFTPSRSALEYMATTWTAGYRPMREMLEKAIGQVWVDKLKDLPTVEAAKEWKRLIEDFVAKDPSEQDVSPHLWSAIRYYYGGALNIPAPGDEVPPAQSGGLVEQRDEDQRDQGAASISRTAPAPHDWANPPKPDKQDVIMCAGENQVLQVLSDWENFTSEEQLRRIFDHAGPIYVTQQPDDQYFNKDNKYKSLNYHDESSETNRILFEYGEDQAFLDGYHAGVEVLNTIKSALNASNPPGTSFKIELRRQYIQPAIAELWKVWYGLPDEDAMRKGGWTWKKLVEKAQDEARERDYALCPGDFMAPSRGSVFPRPNETIEHYAEAHGAAIRDAGQKFVKRLRVGVSPTPPLIAKLLAAYPNRAQDEVLARNIVGTMIGAIPPMDANLRNIILDWLIEKRLWRHQAAFKAALAGRDLNDSAAAKAASDALKRPISQAMCKRPAPDLLFRTAKRTAVIPRDPKVLKRDEQGNATEQYERPAAVAEEGDMVVVSLASASQWSLDERSGTYPDGDISIVFGGKRTKARQGYDYGPDGVTHTDDGPVHACPAQKMAMGGMTGILAALLDAGTIQALPASLIVRISDW